MYTCKKECNIILAAILLSIALGSIVDTPAAYVEDSRPNVHDTFDYE